jgi:hypothetical protein
LPEQNVPPLNLIIPRVQFAPEKLNIRLEGSYQPVAVIRSGPVRFRARPVKVRKLRVLGRLRWQEHDPHTTDFLTLQLTTTQALPDGVG